MTLSETGRITIALMTNSDPDMNAYIDTTMQPEACAANMETSSRAIITPADYRELTAAIVAAKKLAAWQGQTRVLQERLAHGGSAEAAR